MNPEMNYFCHFLLFVCSYFFAHRVLAQTCAEVFAVPQQEFQHMEIGDSSGFSPLKHILGQRKARLLGRRYQSNPRPSSGGGSRGRDSETHQIANQLGFSQASIEVTRLLDILDPAPPEHSEVPLRRKISIKHNASNEIVYILTDAIGSIDVPGETFKFMAEMLSLVRSEAQKAKINEDFSDEFIREWFAQAVRFSRSGTLGFVHTHHLIGVMDDLIDKHIYPDRQLDSDQKQQLRIFGLVEVAARNQTKAKHNLVKGLEALGLLFNERIQDQTYNQFVRAFLYRLENPTKNEYMEVSEDGHGQFLVQIDVSRMTRILNMYSGLQKIYHLRPPRILDYPNWEAIPALDNHRVIEATTLIEALKIYRERTQANSTTQKDPLLQMAVLLMHLRDRIGFDAFSDFADAVVRKRFDFDQTALEPYLKVFLEKYGRDRQTFNSLFYHALVTVGLN